MGEAIKRYELEHVQYLGDSMVAQDDGEWVLYYDHKAVVDALVEALEGMLVAFGHYDIGETRAAQAALAKAGRE